MAKKSLFSPVRLLLVITSIGCLSVLFAPVRAQDLLGEEESAAALEDIPVLEGNQDALQTPVIDFSSAITTVDPAISLAELELLLKPLTLEELQVEAAAWFELLRQKTSELSQAEIVVLKQNEQITETREAVKALDEASKTLNQAQEGAEETTPLSSGEVSNEKLDQETERAEEAIEKALQEVEEAASVEAEVKSDDTAQNVIDQAKDDILTQEAEEQAKIDESLKTAETTPTEPTPEASPTPLAEEASEVLGKEEVGTVQEQIKDIVAQDPTEIDDSSQAAEQLTQAADQLEDKIEENTELKKEVLLNATEIR
ncbi:MAG: hypothetical protein ACO30K_19715, partial [bacterium]